mmetsp:Transcript_9422/g.23875  ORF Transcript_9422/g.23875 Transcript_9422/m.23875 type:complete len:204 (+) Transcript_9422:679-1290(+)
MPECFKSFEHALSVLNLSGNALVDTTEMSGFKALKKLHMGRNDISIGQAKNMVSQFKTLEELDFSGCDMCRERTYLRSIIEVSSKLLSKLDGKPIQPFHRKQLMNIQENNKKVQDQRRRSFEEYDDPFAYESRYGGGGGEGFDLTKRFSTTLRGPSGMQQNSTLLVQGVPEPISPRSPREVGSLPGPDSPRGKYTYGCGEKYR